MHLTERRKTEHIVITVSEDVGSRRSSLLECVHLIHRALPQLSLEEVRLETRLLGREVSAPIIVAGMTGGSELGGRVNREIAIAAEALKIGMGVGSQRAALENPELRRTFSVVREEAPSIPIIANIGASQLVEAGDYTTLAAELIDMIEADAVAVHLNPLQEAVQPEGEPAFAGVVEAIREFVKACGKPVIVKETGSGISREDAELLMKTGIWGIDVGGLGGTSFAAVEAIRAKMNGDFIAERVANTFRSWGIPTAASILEVRSVARDVTLIATGGIRSGLDAAKALRLGADLAGVARPIIKAALEGGSERVKKVLESYIKELRIAFFLTGSRDVEELRKRPAIILGELKEWVVARGLEDFVRNCGLLF